MNVFNESNYKDALREQLKHLNASRASRKLSFRSLASKLNIQHTYLSRVMNNDGVHFSDDQVYEMGSLLELTSEEIEYLVLIRSHEVSTSEARKKSLQRKIDLIRQGYKLKAEQGKFHESQLDKDIRFLLDPYSVIILTAFSIDEFAARPKKLCAKLGLSTEKMKEIIKKLSDMGFLEFDSETFSITKVGSPHMHYSTDHPLMRAHQQIMRAMCSTQLLKINDEDKKSFMVTFGADSATVEEIKAKFLMFLKEIEPLVVEAKAENAYQLSFDLFQWC